MTDPIVLRPLDHTRIRQAFPLVQSVLPGTTLPRWTSFARSYASEGKGRSASGIMAVENQSGYIVGLFTHEARDELAHGQTLSIGNLLIADFPGREQAMAYVIDIIETMANLRGCDAIVVDLDVAFSGEPPTCAWSIPVFERRGFHAVGPSQCRKPLRVRRPGLALAVADRMPQG